MIGMTASQRVFQWFNYAFLTLLSLSMLLPFLHIVAGSFSDGQALLQGKVTVIPVRFTFANYKAVLGDPNIWKAFGVTVFITVVGTFVNLFFTSLMAYGLSKDNLRWRTLIMLYILFTMIFQAPIIPTYLVVKGLGLLNTLWSLIIPGAISAFNLIIMITFFKNIPEGLVDSAKIDGCGEYRTLWKIVIPLSLPVLSTIGLFYAVGHWNGYFSAMMYIRDPNLFPLQVRLRQLIVASDLQEMMQRAALTINSLEGLKMASIMVATVPVLFIYPFIQKHFVRGAMLGSIKG